MEWIVIISCIYSHTWSGSLYCLANKDLEPAYGKNKKEECEKWAEEYLNTKYHIHNGQFEWGYRCEQRKIPNIYKPKKLD